MSCKKEDTFLHDMFNVLIQADTLHLHFEVNLLKLRVGYGSTADKSWQYCHSEALRMWNENHEVSHGL